MDGREGISVVVLAGSIVGGEVCGDELGGGCVDGAAEGFKLARV